MRKSSLISLFTLAICSSSFANETHKVGAILNYNLDQDSSTGYGAFYQWQFAESFEFEANYHQSNDILIESNNSNVAGDYSQLLLGANFLKHFNDDITLKAGTGVGYVTTSSNELLVNKQAIAPYIKLSASYQVTEQFSVEFGQFSHFNSQALDTNHSIFLGFSLNFGQANSYVPIEAQPKASQQKQLPTQQPSYQQTLPVSTTKAPAISATTGSAWFVQLGAFSNQLNAHKALAKFSNLTKVHTLSVVKANNFYRIVSAPISNKQRAEDLAQAFLNNYQVKGYVTYLSVD